jgi:Mechanosensitive ion channel
VILTSTPFIVPFPSDIQSRMQFLKKQIPGSLADEDDAQDNESTSANFQPGDGGMLFDPNNRNPLTGSLSSSEKMKLMQLLERWEEPERDASRVKVGLTTAHERIVFNTHNQSDTFSSFPQNHVSIASVLKFRNALACIKNDYPFSFAFGIAATRESCLESSQELYRRLAMYHGDADCSLLRFDTLALIAVRADGEIDQLKAKELVRVFRPDRQGNLTVLDFVKSVDAVYKELRFLQASIDNSSQIDKSFENIVNVIFYAIVVSIVLSQLGFDPFSLFLSLSSVVLAFAFAIGSASSKYIEGLLFILVRRPYGIGDLVHVSNIEADTSLGGSIGWQVNNVTLFETEMTWLPTMERCSISNGSLANSRIINWARSPTARFVIFLYFPFDTRYETIEIMMVSVEEYLKARPREWLALNAFRVNHLQGEQAWMRVEVVVQHRESWQNVGTVLDSKGNLMSYCAEVQKMLGVQYKAPPMPIDLNLAPGTELSANNPNISGNSVEGTSSDIYRRDGRASQAEVFSSMARNRHKIVV